MITPLFAALLAPVLLAGPEPVSISPANQPALALSTRLRYPAADQIEGNAAISWNQVVTAAAWNADLNAQIDNILATATDRFDITLANRVLSDNYDTLAPFITVAARRDSCDWQSPFRHQGLGTLLPELGRHRTLARLLRLRARVALQINDFQGAIDAIRNGLELAADYSHSRSAIQALVGTAIASSMLDELEIVASRPGAPSLYWALADLPRPFMSMSTLLLYEEAMIDFTLPVFREIEQLPLDDERAVGLAAKANRDLASMLQSASSPASGDIAAAARIIAFYPAAKAWMISTGLSPTRVSSLPVSYVVIRHELAQFRLHSDQLFRWLTLPYPEAEPGLKAFLADRATHPVNNDSLASWVPSLEKVFGALWNLERRVAVLRATEAIRLHVGSTNSLPPSLDAISIVPVPRDPITGDPFRFRLDGDTAVILGPPIPFLNNPETLEHRVRIAR